jgi:hypothetical protein
MGEAVHVDLSSVFGVLSREGHTRGGSGVIPWLDRAFLQLSIALFRAQFEFVLTKLCPFEVES